MRTKRKLAQIDAERKRLNAEILGVRPGWTTTDLSRFGSPEFPSPATHRVPTDTGFARKGPASVQQALAALCTDDDLVRLLITAPNDGCRREFVAGRALVGAPLWVRRNNPHSLKELAARTLARKFIPWSRVDVCHFALHPDSPTNHGTGWCKVGCGCVNYAAQVNVLCPVLAWSPVVRSPCPFIGHALYPPSHAYRNSPVPTFYRVSIGLPYAPTGVEGAVTLSVLFNGESYVLGQGPRIGLDCRAKKLIFRRPEQVDGGRGTVNPQKPA